MLCCVVFCIVILVKIISLLQITENIPGAVIPPLSECNTVLAPPRFVHPLLSGMIFYDASSLEI